MRTYISEPRKGRLQLGLQCSGQPVHSSGYQTGLGLRPCSHFASRNQHIRQPFAGQCQHNRRLFSGWIQRSRNLSALLSRNIRQSCSAQHRSSHWQFSWLSR